VYTLKEDYIMMKKVGEFKQTHLRHLNFSDPHWELDMLISQTRQLLPYVQNNIKEVVLFLIDKGLAPEKAMPVARAALTLGPFSS